MSDAGYVVKEALDRAKAMHLSEFETGRNTNEIVQSWQPAYDALASLEDELRRLDNENKRLVEQLQGEG